MEELGTKLTPDGSKKISLREQVDQIVPVGDDNPGCAGVILEEAGDFRALCGYVKADRCGWEVPHSSLHPVGVGYSLLHTCGNAEAEKPHAQAGQCDNRVTSPRSETKIPL